MAKTDNNPADLGTGILVPDLMYRYRVRFPHGGRFCKEAGQVLTMQTTKCNFDYVNKTININVEQASAQSELHDVITYLIDSPGSLIVESVAGDGEANYAIIFYSCKCITHEYNLDYTSSKAATHKMTFAYSSLATQDRDKIT